MIELFPIKTEEDYNKALNIIRKNANPDKEDVPKIEVLLQLMAHWDSQYEEKTIYSASTILRELMVTREIDHLKIATILGTYKTHVSSILSGKKKMNTEQARKLCKEFGLEMSLFSDLVPARVIINKRNVVKKQAQPISKSQKRPLHPN